MGRRSRFLVLALTALVGLSWRPDDASARMAYGRSGEPLRRSGVPGFELVLEGGLAEPVGDQADDFGTADGYGAGTGFELGLRFRQYLTPQLAVAPTFHYVQFGSSAGVADFPEGADLAYEVQTSLYRYGLDLQWLPGDPGAPIRPCLTGGVALAHNRYRDSLQGYQDFEAGMNGPSWTAGAGLKMGAIELSASYVWNRFDTEKLSAGFAKQSYDWDYALVRLGIAFGAH